MHDVNDETKVAVQVALWLCKTLEKLTDFVLSVLLLLSIGSMVKINMVTYYDLHYQ